LFGPELADRGQDLIYLENSYVRKYRGVEQKKGVHFKMLKHRLSRVIVEKSFLSLSLFLPKMLG
jgi:hypothetical protein